MDLNIIRWGGQINFQFEDWPSDFVAAYSQRRRSHTDTDGALKCAAVNKFTANCRSLCSGWAQMGLSRRVVTKYQFLTLVLTNSIWSLFLLTSDELKSAVHCSIAIVSSRFDLRVIRLCICRDMPRCKAASFKSKNPHELAFVLFWRPSVIQCNDR
jgi:hypothetical protein